MLDVLTEKIFEVCCKDEGGGKKGRDNLRSR